MLPTRQCAHVGGKQVGEVPTVAAVVPGQGLPQAPGRSRVAAAQHLGHDAPAGAPDSQPEPDFAPPLAHKRPHFVQLKRLPFAVLSFFRPQAGQGRARRLRFFLPVCPPSSRTCRWPARCYAASCTRPVAFLLGRSGPPALAPRGARSPLVGTRFTLVFGPPAAAAVLPHLLTATPSA